MNVIIESEVVNITASKDEAAIIKEALTDFFNAKNCKPLTTHETALEELMKRREDKKMAFSMVFDFPEPELIHSH